MQKHLDRLGFNLVGYGCTTCIGNSGPLPEEISHTIHEHHLAVAAVLSGNRNFEGRVNHDVRANYLASPPLVVAYALAGSVTIDLLTEPLGTDEEGDPVYLKDIWPSAKEVAKVVRKAVKKDMFKERYGDVFRGDPEWRKIEVKGGQTYAWDSASTYVQNPPYFADMSLTPSPVTDIENARILGLFLELDHHRPHLAGRQHQEGQPGRPLSDRARRRHPRFQLLRLAARQSRGDDARHLRQYAHQEPDGAWRRRRRHRALPHGRADADLRRGDALPGGLSAARRLRRQGIRHRLIARLGGQGHAAARRARGDRRRASSASTAPI